MKRFLHLPLLVFLCLALACTQNQFLPSNKKVFGDTCSDTMIVYKQTTIAGAQATDLDGNPIHQKILDYHIFLLSPSTKLKVDSLLAGQKRIGNLRTSLVDTTPVYWESVSGKMLLVNKTKCPVLKIQFQYSTNNQLSETEENSIVLYYSVNGLQKKLLTNEVNRLPQMVTE